MVDRMELDWVYSSVVGSEVVAQLKRLGIEKSTSRYSHQLAVDKQCATLSRGSHLTMHQSIGEVANYFPSLPYNHVYRTPCYNPNPIGDR